MNKKQFGCLMSIIIITALVIIGCVAPSNSGSGGGSTAAAGGTASSGTSSASGTSSSNGYPVAQNGSKLTLEAEDAIFNSGIIETATTGYTGTGYVTLNVTNGYVEWTFNMTSSGSASAKWYFINDSGSSISVIIGATGASDSTKGFGASATWTNTSRTITLPAGLVKIRCTTPTASLKLDRLELTVAYDASAFSTSSTSSNSSTITSSSVSTSSSSISYSLPSSSGSPIGYANANGGTTGGASGSVIYVSTGDELQAAIDNRATITTPLIIYVTGTITLANTTLDYILIKGSSDSNLVQNLSIIGVGTSGELDGIGFKIWRVKNIIIQNLKIHHVLYNTGEGDAINISGPASNIWIDHCELYNSVGDLDGSGTIGDSGDKDYYDGLLDIKYAGTQYITISNNIFHDAYKTSLFGYTTSDARDWYVTIYGNYYYNCNSRLPLVRGGGVHVLNNYYNNNTGSGSNNRCGGTNLYEGNYYKDSRDVIGWFYDDVSGYWDLGPGTTDSNYYDNISWTPISGDIYSTVSSLGFSDTGAFTPGYIYTAKTATDVPAYVTANAGVGKL